MELMASPPPLQSWLSKFAGAGLVRGEWPSNDATISQAAGLWTGPRGLVRLWAGTQLQHAAASACLVRRIFGVGCDELPQCRTEMDWTGPENVWVQDGTGVSTCPLTGQVCDHRNSSHLDLQRMVSRRLYFALVTVCRLQLAHQKLPGQA